MASTPYKHNAKPGDLIQISHEMYDHWAIYVGENEVVHFGPSSADLGIFSSLGKSMDGSEGRVRLQKIWDVAPSNGFQINNLLDGCYKPRERQSIVKEAREMVGQELSYSVTLFNCEHFVTQLRYGKPESRQVEMAVAVGGVAAVAAGAVALGAMLSSRKKDRQ